MKAKNIIVLGIIFILASCSNSAKTNETKSVRTDITIHKDLNDPILKK
jgi:hypothetical protein